MVFLKGFVPETAVMPLSPKQKMITRFKKFISSYGKTRALGKTKGSPKRHFMKQNRGTLNSNKSP